MIATKFSITLIVALGSKTFFTGIIRSFQHSCGSDSVSEAIVGLIGPEIQRKLFVVPSFGLLLQ